MWEKQSVSSISNFFTKTQVWVQHLEVNLGIPTYPSTLMVSKDRRSSGCQSSHAGTGTDCAQLRCAVNLSTSVENITVKNRGKY